MKSSLQTIAQTREVLLAGGVMAVILPLFFKIGYAHVKTKLEQTQSQLQTIEAEKKGILEPLEKLRKSTQLAQKKAEEARTTANVKLDILNGARQPEFSRVTTFMEHITASAAANKLKLEQLSTEGAQNVGTTIRNPVKVQATGDYISISSFLNQIDQIKAMIAIDSVMLAGSASEPTKMRLEILTALYQVEGIRAPDEKTGTQP